MKQRAVASECDNKQVPTFGFPQGTLNETASVSERM